MAKKQFFLSCGWDGYQPFGLSYGITKNSYKKKLQINAILY